MAAPSSPERWKRIEDLFHRALELEKNEQTIFLDTACAGDPDLRAELESLLQSSESSADFIEAPLHAAALDFCAGRAPAALPEGSRVGHYRILSTLGSGGMGRVYLAEDTRLARKVALKTLTPGLVHNARALGRFEQEARSASALNHPNILTIYEVGQFEGSHYIVSEFIDGITLREKLAGGRLGVDAALDIATQVAAGLAAAHAAGIEHRDIKPENIILRNDGLVKIVDFGIAKLSRETGSEERVPGAALSATLPGVVLGTARYMSPEQARGLPAAQGTDVFSLGAVLYEMLAGKPAFEGDTTSDVIAEILKGEPPPLSRMAPETPPELCAAVAHALRKDAETRCRAVDMLTGLRALKRDREFRAQFGRPPKPRSRRALLLALALVIATLAGYLWWSRSARPPAPGVRSLAILPFRNLKPDPATDFLGFSLADAAITKLGYVSSLTLRPSSAVESYRNRTVDPRKAAAELNVNTLLTGAYLKDGDDLRITTQLIDVRADRVIWRDTIDIKYEKLLTVEDRVARQIIAGLELTLSPAEASHVQFAGRIDQSAYEQYLRGVDLYAMNDYLSAIHVLRESARMEPNYALTWAHLGRAYSANASLQFGGREQYAQAQAAYEKALALEPALLEPRIWMANLLTDTGRVEQSVPLLRDVLAINPNSAEAHWELGYAYRFAGMLDDSVREGELARRIDPEVKINNSALNSYFYRGQYDAFLASLPDIDSVYILFYRGLGEYYKRDYAAATAHWDRAFSRDPSLLQAEIGEALADAIRRHYAAGINLLRGTESKIDTRGVTDAEGIYKVSQAYAALGDRPSALRLLRRSVEGGFFCYPYLISDPLLETLHGDRRFEQLKELARRRHEQFRYRFFQ
ncbi:MAG: protein kinase [Candidatus Sulfopaludibacter sp.]|nr:protein kinase [Candidatus Sulfopaludibacter sp.]